MEEIAQVLHSYFHFRNAVLRSLAYKNLSKSDFSNITGLDGNSKYRRQTNPGLWKPVEIYRLAHDLHLTDGTSSRLVDLASLIDRLPEAEKKIVFKTTLLSTQKLSARLQNLAVWQPQELEKLHVCCTQHRLASYTSISSYRLGKS